MGTITNATPLANGQTVSFDSSSADNYYSFTLNSAGNVLFSGSDVIGSSIDSLKIYNSSFALADTVSYLTGSSSKSLSAGTYYVQAVDSLGGSFSISSTAMSGATISATPLANGQTVSFDSSSADNYYSFTLNSAGNVLFSGSDVIGSSIDSLKIYNSSFALADTVSYLTGSSSKSLSAGTYYVQAVDSLGGSFSISSTAMSGATISATPLANGQTVSFDSSSADNYYSFTLNSAGNVLFSGSDVIGSSIDSLKIYNSSFALADTVSYLTGSSSKSLSAGTYYVQAVDSLGGSFSISSTAMSGATISATPLANGQTVSFDSSSADNYYSFTLNSAGNVLFSGSDVIGSSIDSLKIYNSSFALADTVSYLTGSSSKSLSAGTYYVQAVDSLGGSFSISSTAMSGTPTALTAPSNLDLSSTDDTGLSSSDNITKITSGLTITGSATASSTVKLYDTNGTTLLGTTTANSSGIFSTDVSLSAGTHSITAKATNTSGTTSTASSPLSITVDTTAPTANLTSITDNVGSITGLLSSGATTDDTSLAIAGTCESGATVNVYNGTTLLGSATVSATNWTYNATVVNGSTYQFNAKETDLAGNISAATSNFSVICSTNTTLTPTQNISTFVERLYTNVLGRPSDASGLSSWVNALQTSNASDVAKSFFNSQEFLNANYSDTAYVQKLYSTFLDRTYDQGGLTHWLSQLSGGMSRSAVLDGFAQSSEFATIAQSYGIDAYESGGGTTTPSNPNLSPVQSFVERFYTEVLGRASDASGLANWSSGLQNGSKTADDIAQGFFFSQEFVNRNLSNSDFIDVAYETLLNRQADSGGKSNWLTQLNGGMSRSTMLDGFIYSAEFDTLADSYGIEVGTPPQPAPPVDDTITIDDIVGSYTLDSVYARISQVTLNLDANDLDGSYMNIQSNGRFTMHIEIDEYGQSETTTATISSITDDTITAASNAYDEGTIGYEFDGSHLTFIIEESSGYVEYDWLLL